MPLGVWLPLVAEHHARASLTKWGLMATITGAAARSTATVTTLSTKSPDSGFLGRVTASAVEALRIIACAMSSLRVHRPAFMPRRHQGYDTCCFLKRKHDGIRQGIAGDPAGGCCSFQELSTATTSRGCPGIRECLWGRSPASADVLL
jgi:hypothetical protein